MNTTIQKEMTEQLQKSCHEMVELIMKEKPDCNYQDATNVWLFTKLAEFEKRISSLEEVPNKYLNSLTNQKQ